MSIHILSPEVANQIAAGEVVERPASVVKELVENSLDAGSTRIEIEIQEGGLSSIVVRDNGFGMDGEDLKKSVLRHATSKIENIDDVFSLQSFGFRGEALAAISAISQCVLVTRDKDSDHGKKLEVLFGEYSHIEDVPSSYGTTITVERLFENVPVRKKYLKTANAEFRALYRECLAFALANSDVSFVLTHNDKNIFDVPAHSFEERVEQLLSLRDAFFTVDNAISTMNVRGVLSKPDKAQKSRNNQFLFVNGRHIQDKNISFAIRDAYMRTCGLDKAMYPPFVLFLDIDPLLVDVNVHPRKTEVAFSDPRDIFSFLSSTVKQALSDFSGEHAHNVARSFSPAQEMPRPSVPSFSFQAPRESFSERVAKRESLPPTGTDFLTQGIAPVDSSDFGGQADENMEDLRFVGQVARKYILAENEQGLFIFDQHALHERIRFEMLLQEAEKKKVQIQPLLVPEEISLSPDRYNILEENKIYLSDLGIECVFQDQQIVIRAIPLLLEKESLSHLIEDFARYFEEEKVGEHSLEKILRVALEYKSCRGSVKFGDTMEEPEMKLLLKQYQGLEQKLLCPHGRPNHVFWSFEEVDKGFYR